MVAKKKVAPKKPVKTPVSNEKLASQVLTAFDKMLDRLNSFGAPIDVNELTDEERQMILVEPARRLLLTDAAFRNKLLSDLEASGRGPSAFVYDPRSASEACNIQARVPAVFVTVDTLETNLVSAISVFDDLYGRLESVLRSPEPVPASANQVNEASTVPMVNKISVLNTHLCALRERMLDVLNRLEIG